MKKSKEEIRALADYIVNVLDNKKAIDVEMLEISDKSSLADYFIVCSGQSSTQVRALIGEVEAKVQEEFGLSPKYSEGFQTRKWVLLDYIDIVVHVFLHEERQYYNLERLWLKTAERKDTTLE